MRRLSTAITSVGVSLEIRHTGCPRKGLGVFATNPLRPGNVVLRISPEQPRQTSPSKAVSDPVARIPVTNAGKSVHHPSAAAGSATSKTRANNFVLGAEPASPLDSTGRVSRLLPPQLLADARQWPAVVAPRQLVTENGGKLSMETLHQRLAMRARAPFGAAYRAHAFFNHSCAPNLTRSFRDGHMVLRAARDIPAGIELEDAYFWPLLPLAQRRRRMFQGTSQAFRCECPRCLTDAEFAESNATWADSTWASLEDCVEDIASARRRRDAVGLAAVRSRLQTLADGVCDRQCDVAAWTPVFATLADVMALQNCFADAALTLHRALPAVKMAVPNSAYHVEFLTKYVLYRALAQDLGKDFASDRDVQELRSINQRCYGDETSDSDEHLDMCFDFLQRCYTLTSAE
eukprot:TRINITY_DN56031_c0_g1_i1.p1 TRINITY_DN56031_c0_g1~~TRINITY_DN56031_c0_g1_i1.p1  ORF type:complete len:404 (-),score=42.91 TRINITY_DN56031_c0_g1_i1:636-1847(-)